MENQTQPAETPQKQAPLPTPQVVRKSRKISIISILLILLGVWVIGFSYIMYENRSSLPYLQSCDTTHPLCDPIVDASSLNIPQAIITLVALMLSIIGLVLGVITLWGHDSGRVKRLKKTLFILVLLSTTVLLVFTGWHQSAYI